MKRGARLFRYRVMQDLLNAEEVLLLAHHADDLVETMTLSFLKGTFGGRLLQAEHGRILRPFLLLNDIPGRTAILQIVQDRHIPFVQDLTNNAEKHRRNFLRKRILPEIEGEFGALSGRMLRLWEEWKDVQDALDLSAPPSPWEACLFLGQGAARCPVEAWRALPAYFRIMYARRVMLRCAGIDHANSSEYRIPRRFILTLPVLDRNKPSRRAEGFACTFIKEKNWIYLIPTLALSLKKGYFIPVNSGRTCLVHPFADVVLNVRMETSGHYTQQNNFCLRSLGETKKVINQQVPTLKAIVRKVPLWLRDSITVFEDGKKIFGLLYPDLISKSWILAMGKAGMEKQFFVEQVS